MPSLELTRAELWCVIRSLGSYVATLGSMLKPEGHPEMFCERVRYLETIIELYGRIAEQSATGGDQVAGLSENDTSSRSGTESEKECCP